MARRGQLLWASFAALMVLGSTNTATSATRCMDDGDCSGRLLCRQSRCVPVHCHIDAQCPAGRMCLEELCRIRQCYSQRDCPVETRCSQGLCTLPQPTSLGQRDRNLRWYGHLEGIRFLLGPAFPSGLLAQLDLPIETSRWISIGIGGTLDHPGLTWKLGFRSSPLRSGTLSLDIWAGANGYITGALETDESASLGAPPSFSVGGLLSGSGRFLFAADSPVNALWWGGGGGLSWRHGPKNRYLLRLDAGTLLLFDDRYPAGRDFALLPAASLQWGVAF